MSDANSAMAQNVERLALRILETAPVKEGIAEGLQRYAASDMARKPDAMRYAKSLLDNTATLAALYAAMGAMADPVFIWVYATPRKWNGYVVPGSRWYGDNADALYRAVRVDERASYEITMSPGEALPSQLSFMMYGWLMYETVALERADIPLGTLEITDATPRNPDGSITITVGPEPANGCPNHLQLKPGVRQVFVREIRGDWSLLAVGLSIRRTHGAAPVTTTTLNEQAKEAAVYIDAATAGTIKLEVVFGKLLENELSPLRVRWIEETGSAEQKLVTDEPLGPDRALGFGSFGLFNLQDDDALIITLNTMGARYLSVNSYRPFYVSTEHVYRTGSLNNYQSEANPDGSFTFVFARQDPGVYNWIDVSGIPFGEIAVRWQTLTHPVSGTLKNGVQRVKVVKLDDLRNELPPTTRWVTEAQRAEQRATRAEQFKLRCLGTPCEVGGELDRLY
jgi:hypothetical protein